MRFAGPSVSLLTPRATMVLVGPELARGFRAVTFFVTIAATSELGPYQFIHSLALAATTGIG